MPAQVHVAVGVIVNGDGQILISRRDAGAHQGGLWEFPGGKREAGEDITAALARELEEELGIVPSRATPLLEVAHDYGDKQVLLDVYVVWEHTGSAHSREGQPLAWVAPGDLCEYRFPAANEAIVLAVQELGF